jgi:hypothetical protein
MYQAFTKIFGFLARSVFIPRIYLCMAQNQTTIRNEMKNAMLMLAVGALAVSNVLAADFTRHEEEILFTDSQSAVLKANMTSGGSAVIATGEKLVQPFGICIGNKGEYFVSDTGCLGIVGIDPQTGSQRVLATSPGLGIPFGIASEQGGTLLVANAQSLVRVNPETGAHRTVTSGGYLTVPLAVAVAVNGTIFVADAMGSIVEVNGRTGAQKLITSGGYLNRPQGIAVRGKDIYVTGVATSDGNFGVGRVVHVDAKSGQQTVLAEGQHLVGPVGITIDKKGNLIIADPYTINEESADLFDGGIVGVDAVTGAQKLIARGKQSFVNPRCVALVRATAE